MDNLFEPGNDLPNENQLRAELTNKWKTKFPEAPPELIDSKVESDLYIKTIERQKDEMRNMYMEAKNELQAKAKFEDLLDQMQKNNLQVDNTPPKEVESQKMFDPAEFEKLASDTYEKLENRKRETDNFNRVQTRLKERFGDNYANVLKDQQSALGLTMDEVNALAKKSPEAFFRVMGLNEQQRSDFQSPPRNNQRSDSFAPKVVKRDWNYYQELKKTNPMLYLDPKIAVQMHNDALELGEAFGMPD